MTRLSFELFSFFLIIGCMGSTSSGGPGNGGSALYQVKRTGASIQLDGKASDPARERAVLLDNFRFPWLQREAPATEFRALWNETYLYFQFIVEDGDIVLGEGATRDASVLGSDRVELFFAVNEALQPYYTLEMDPRTWVFDARGEHYRKVDPSWTWVGLELAASLTKTGYIVEGRIPMSSFTGLSLWQDEARRQLRCGVFRAEFSHSADGVTEQNWISWIIPDTPKPDFHTPSAFGLWELID